MGHHEHEKSKETITTTIASTATSHGSGPGVASRDSRRRNRPENPKRRSSGQNLFPAHIRVSFSSPLLSSLRSKYPLLNSNTHKHHVTKESPTPSRRCRHPRIPARSPNPKHQREFVENPGSGFQGRGRLLPGKTGCLYHKGRRRRQIRKQIQSQLGQGLPGPRFQRCREVPIPKKPPPPSYRWKGPCHVVPVPCIEQTKTNRHTPETKQTSRTIVYQNEYICDCSTSVVF